MEPERRPAARRESLFAGVLLGTAVGDAIGLPRENMSARRAERMFGRPPLRHRFLVGRGMTSDDTEHACMIGQSLLHSAGDPARFARAMAWQLRWWLLGLPSGTGLATLRSCIRLWLGVRPDRSGVWSAGNGPAMRSALLGVYADGDIDLLCKLVAVSTRLTHADPRAYEGALIIALAASTGSRRGPAGICPKEIGAILLPRVQQPDLRGNVEQAVAVATAGLAAAELVNRLGLERGVSGFVNHTVPAALCCWLRHPGDFRAAVEEVIGLGGDTDTTGAIVGALVGATAGEAVIPPQWLAGLMEWPRSVRWMRELAVRLARQADGDRSVRPMRRFWPGLLARNVLFNLAVLGHGLRRLLPPY